MEQTYFEEESSKGFDFKRYLAKLGKNWYWFILATALFLGGVFTYLYYTPTTYNISAYVLVKKPSSNMLGGSAFGSNTQEQWLDLNSEIFKFKSGSLIRKVVDSLKLTTQIKTDNNGRQTIVPLDSIPFQFSAIRALPEMNSPVYKLTLLNSTYNIEAEDKNYSGVYNRPLAIGSDTLLIQVKNGISIPAKKQYEVELFGINQTVSKYSSRVEVAPVPKGWRRFIANYRA